jgi:hypothetical protein
MGAVPARSPSFLASLSFPLPLLPAAAFSCLRPHLRFLSLSHGKTKIYPKFFLQIWDKVWDKIIAIITGIGYD